MAKLPLRTLVPAPPSVALAAIVAVRAVRSMLGPVVGPVRPLVLPTVLLATVAGRPAFLAAPAGVGIVLLGRLARSGEAPPRPIPILVPALAAGPPDLVEPGLGCRLSLRLLGGH